MIKMKKKKNQIIDRKIVTIMCLTWIGFLLFFVFQLKIDEYEIQKINNEIDEKQKEGEFFYNNESVA